jgi:hypothetical protein
VCWFRSLTMAHSRGGFRPRNFVIFTTKTLYTQSRDEQDNVSSIISDTIILDTLPPMSAAATLPITTYHPIITLTWTGEDAGSGIDFYDVQIRDGVAGNWTSLVHHMPPTQTVLGIQSGHTYCFRSQATDRAGNGEAWPPGNGVTCFPPVPVPCLPLVARNFRSDALDRPCWELAVRHPDRLYWGISVPRYTELQHSLWPQE